MVICAGCTGTTIRLPGTTDENQKGVLKDERASDRLRAVLANDDAPSAERPQATHRHA